MNCFFQSMVFLVLAIVWSVLYGVFCFTIFIWFDKEAKDPVTRSTIKIKTCGELRKKKIPWIVHQFWFNFAGVFFGWMVIYYALQKDIVPSDIRGLFLWVVGFIGITGHLPMATIDLIKALAGYLKAKTGKPEQP